MTKPKVKRHPVVQPRNKPFRFIPLSQGQNAIVNVEDFEWLSQWNWSAMWNTHTKSFYAYRRGDKRGIYMHALIAGGRSDHVDHDTLNNRRSNLRLASYEENSRNQRLRADNKSGYKGVDWYERYKKWRAYITVAGKHIHIGFFHSIKEASDARDQVALKLHKEFASLNSVKT